MRTHPLTSALVSHSFYLSPSQMCYVKALSVVVLSICAPKGFLFKMKDGTPPLEGEAFAVSSHTIK